jgi:competence protein ComEC
MYIYGSKRCRFMDFLRANPFVRLLPPFIVGIAFAEYVVCALTPLLLWTGLCLSVMLLWFAHHPFMYRYRWIFGTGIVLLMFGSGWLRALLDDERRPKTHFSRHASPGPYWMAVIADAPVPGRRLKMPVQILSNGHYPGETTEPCAGNALIFVSRNAAVDSLRYGDTIVVRCTLRPAASPTNPHAFDYARYLHFKDIHYLAYVSSDDVYLCGRDGGQRIWRLALSQRSKLLHLLTRHFREPASHAVASALLVGYKEELPDDLEEAYIKTGSMHALAVSGTHVGFVYAGLFLILRQLRLRGPWKRRIETPLVLGGVWAFTLLTGASAAVLRAAWMFSLFIVGRALFRRTSVWNTLAASAFVLLWTDPDYLYDAGFQLSYAAVAGMVYFYPQMKKRLPELPAWSKEAINILVIGVAAQLGTLPLSLYYFHQFPVYFWLAGWVVVVGGAVFLWGGALLILLDSLYSPIADLVGQLLLGIVWVMNTAVVTIQHLPGSVVDGIWIPWWAVFVLYAVIAFAAGATALSKGRLLLYALYASAFLCAIRLSREMTRLKQQELTIYHAGRYNLIDVVSGRHVYTWSDSIPVKQALFANQMHRWALGVRTGTSLSMDSSWTTKNLHWRPPLLQFAEKNMLIISHQTEFPLTQDTHSTIDFIWVTQPTAVNIDALLSQYKPTTVILGGTLPYKQVAIWQEAAARYQIHCHRVVNDGAWRITL